MTMSLPLTRNISKELIVDRLLDLSLRKIIRRFQRSVLRKNLPITAKASVIELLGHDQYREISRLDRYKEGELVIQGYSVRFTDNVALFGMLDEIFVRENYKFHSESNSPAIIDCGANIGLSVLYFKSQYPHAVIHAFEPDLAAYEKLVANMEANGFKDVFTYNAAVWIEDGELNFETDGSWGGHIGDNASALGVTVKARKLDGLLDKRVDFLKIDIEGAESDVIMHAKELIANNVERLFFEWHSMTGVPQRLGEILAFFEQHGFRYHIKEASNKPTPFIYKPSGRMDSQLDVFLWK
jgi:FkbM family methyltransferase